MPHDGSSPFVTSWLILPKPFTLTNNFASSFIITGAPYNVIVIKLLSMIIEAE